MSSCKNQEALGLVARKSKGRPLKDVLSTLFAQNPTHPACDKLLNTDSEKKKVRLRNNGRLEERKRRVRSKRRNTSGSKKKVPGFAFRPSDK
jgi:nucleoid DNA-binding protein